MKVATWNGCKDCPYKQFNRELENYECYKFGFDLGSNPPEKPHFECKLNDFPTEEDVNLERNDISFLMTAQSAFKQGANYVLKEITK